MCFLVLIQQLLLSVLAVVQSRLSVNMRVPFDIAQGFLIEV